LTRENCATEAGQRPALLTRRAFFFARSGRGQHRVRLHFPAHLLFPLGSAFLYALGALAIKRANQFGIGLWRISFLANWAMAFCMAPVWLLGGEIPPGLWWQPVVVGFFFFTAQTFMFLALTRGDVSVATPIMGTKVLMVALFSLVLLQGPVPLQWWIGALLSTAGIFFLSRGVETIRRGALQAALFAIGAATAFAVNDVLVQKWAPTWGIGRFLPIMFACVALMSFAFVPLFHAPLREIPRKGRVWVAAGAIILGVQAVGILFAIGRFGDATAVNIVYSLRGMLSVVIVWVVGHWFLNEEQKLGRGVLTKRLIGSALMVSAVVLVVV
jgi:drug/metabolite transporter (DMT)-like permease